MKKAALLVLAALMIPTGVALAAHGAKPVPQVTYELKGTLSGYTAYNSATKANGTISILVSSVNEGVKSLNGQTLTFPVDAKTKITLKGGLTGITNGDGGMVKVVAAKKIAPADLAAMLQAQAAKQIVDQGAKK
jgi:hypothetical protein